ncbi:2-(3-amino-3-carboxypropyl)histidine synthase subunit 2 isoform X2 [Impatiens glandulifera]|uniref:2-(3-amino-3-carboxypropyl)histidine synthase subunit 2 isoform X2 n=1 Tax=Impatiens glandulifera TaxID=253017 RepID=UPI001FB135D5|nr:2-(3-amino-3-carboxypropyl)histidine synthase subunit 2 isoform X2 [Impatiens glandulifera]
MKEFDAEFDFNYEISQTADFIRSRNYSRVALQFPDHLIKDSIRVVSSLNDRLQDTDTRLYVMADTTFGSCCVDEVGAAHANADCVIHYGHTCLSKTSTLPAFFVFGKAKINVTRCVEKLSNHALTTSKPILVLFGLEYAHAIQDIRKALTDVASRLHDSESRSVFYYADVVSTIIEPSNTTSNGKLERVVCSTDTGDAKEAVTSKYSIGGLTWSLPKELKIEDCFLYWIGADNSSFSNAVLTFNECEIIRYDAVEDFCVSDVSQLKRILKRRYYLVEKAKDANIVGILVGTLGVAGYLHMINQMKELISAAGKKVYTLAMGRPNPAKLANFPECDVFVYVSCAQTALLDSKEFLAPVITPFEAMIAFNRGKQWTGAYMMEFQNLITSCPVEVQEDQIEEARFSFLQGGYVEDVDLQQDVTKENEGGPLSLVKASENALQVRDKDSRSTIVKSGAEFLAGRSYQGLDYRKSSLPPQPLLVGRSGKASGYKNENIN